MTESAFSLLVAILLLVAFGASGAEDAASPAQALECGLTKRYRRDTRQTIDIVVSRAGRTLRRYEAEVAWKTFDDELRSLIVFTKPADLRQTEVLTIERRDGQDEHFLYLPSLQRVRRISGGHRAERFLGTDLTYEDWEPVRAVELEILAVELSSVRTEPTWRVTTAPTGESAYPRSDYQISRSDCLILEIARFKHGSDKPSKVIRMPAGEVQHIKGERIPALILVEDREAGRTTEVRSRDIELAPDLEREAFEPSRLGRRRSPVEPLDASSP